MEKTIAERLREIADDKFMCAMDPFAVAITGKRASCIGDCEECYLIWRRKLADAIEAEQRAAVAKALLEEVGKPDSVSVGLLVDVATELEVLDADGVPIKVGDTVYVGRYGTTPGNVERICPQETKYGYRDVSVLWGNDKAPTLEQGAMLTHRKPDTQEAIDSDAELFAVTLDTDDEQRFQSLLERQRKLLGGE